MYTLQFIDNV